MLVCMHVHSHSDLYTPPSSNRIFDGGRNQGSFDITGTLVVIAWHVMIMRASSAIV